MDSVSPTQLQCTFPALSEADAQRYAPLLSSKMGGALGSTCAWAAFLGNVGTESAGLTEWTQMPCNGATEAPYCGRGPLQITGSSNYAFCAQQPVCNCPGINTDPASASTTTTGIGTAACVWNVMNGHSLSGDADGTLNGFLKTACIINAGHYPCGQPNGWSSRQSYWAAANRCIGGGGGGSPPPPPPGDDDGGDNDGGDDDGGDDGVGCDCAALSICLANSGGSACFPQQNCQSIEADVSNCQNFGGGAACVPRFCQTDSSASAEREHTATKEKLSAGDDVGITVAVLLALFIALLVGLVVAKHKQGQDSMPERPAPDQK